jgi:hypothetical protein
MMNLESVASQKLRDLYACHLPLFMTPGYLQINFKAQLEAIHRKQHQASLLRFKYLLDRTLIPRNNHIHAQCVSSSHETGNRVLLSVLYYDI